MFKSWLRLCNASRYYAVPRKVKGFFHMSTSQKKFDETYITGHEICETFNVPRSTVLHARRRGMLPDAIVIPGSRSFIWEREKVKPYLEAWKLSLQSRRGELNV